MLLLLSPWVDGHKKGVCSRALLAHEIALPYARRKARANDTALPLQDAFAVEPRVGGHHFQYHGVFDRGGQFHPLRQVAIRLGVVHAERLELGHRTRGDGSTGIRCSLAHT